MDTVDRTPALPRAPHDQALADADQTAANSDQEVSGVDQGASDSDRAAAGLDHVGSAARVVLSGEHP